MARNSSFFMWLMDQVKRQDPIGDLARDVRADRKLPTPLTAQTLFEHIEESGGINAALRAVRNAAREFGTPLPEPEDAYEDSEEGDADESE